MKNNITFKWLNSAELEKDKETITTMFKDCFIQYHYPELKLDNAYFEGKINGLKSYIDADEGHVLGIYDDDKIIGFWWIYYAPFIDKKRCHINCAYIDSSYRNKGLSNEALKLIELKAKSDNCDEIATMHASFNKPIEASLTKNGFKTTRIESVKKL